MRLVSNLAPMALALSFVGCSDTEIMAPSAHGPTDQYPNEIAGFVASAPLPSKQRPVAHHLTRTPGALWLFSVNYGEPHDCPSGCFYSRAWGIMTYRKIGWFEIRDYDGNDTSAIPLFQLDADDLHLLKPEAFRALEVADEWFFTYPFRYRVAASTEIGTEPLTNVAHTIFRLGNLNLARILIQNPVVRGDRDLLDILAALPSGYDEVRDEARALLAEGAN